MSRNVKVAEVDELSPGEGEVISVNGRAIALFNVDGTFYAIDNTCTHVGGPLGEGALDGSTVTCPWHGATFDVTSGKLCGPPARSDVESYPVQVEGNDVFVEFK